MGPGVQRERKGPHGGAQGRREEAPATAGRVGANAEKLKRPGKEAQPGKQENWGRGSRIITESPTKSPKGGEASGTEEKVQKGGRRASGKGAGKQESGSQGGRGQSWAKEGAEGESQEMNRQNSTQSGKEPLKECLPYSRKSWNVCVLACGHCPGNTVWLLSKLWGGWVHMLVACPGLLLGDAAALSCTLVGWQPAVGDIDGACLSLPRRAIPARFMVSSVQKH